jgi:hypothetical protein
MVRAAPREPPTERHREVSGTTPQCFVSNRIQDNGLAAKNAKNTRDKRNFAKV